MRCARCGRRSRKLRVARGPDGRLVFGWCADCLAEVQLRSLGLLPPAPVPVSEAAAPADPRDERANGLRGLGALLVVWGLLLELVGAGSWLGLGRADEGFGPTRIGRGQVFAAAGAVLAVAGAWMGLASLGRGDRRRTLARAVEAAAIGLGLCVLAVGIAFHDRHRDPWVVAGVVLAFVSARAARLLSRARPARPRPLPRA